MYLIVKEHAKQDTEFELFFERVNVEPRLKEIITEVATAYPYNEAIHDQINGFYSIQIEEPAQFIYVVKLGAKD